MEKAIGLIETMGPAASIRVADTMLKSADVMLLKQVEVSLALYTILVEGDLASVKLAVEAGKSIAEKAGFLVAYQVIPHPGPDTKKLI